MFPCITADVDTFPCVTAAGLALVARLAAAPRALDPSSRCLSDELLLTFASFAATQQLSFSRRMRDGLYFHGVSVNGGGSATLFTPSCCKSGR